MEILPLACLLLGFLNLFLWQMVAFQYFEEDGKEVMLVRLHRWYNKRYLDYHYERVHTFQPFA